MSARSSTHAGPFRLGDWRQVADQARGAGSTSAPDGMTASRSSAACAAGLSVRTRASTASTTVGGTISLGLASTSLTKNGLPPVSSNNSAGSTFVAAARSRRRHPR